MTWNRRQVLRGSLLAVANVAILAACAPQQATPAKPAESKPAAPAAAAQPTAVAKPPESKPAADVKPASRTPSGELKIGIHAKLTTLDPQGAQSVDGITHTAMQHVFDTPVGREAATGNLVPRLALSWEAPDPTTWVFKLRPRCQVPQRRRLHVERRQGLAGADHRPEGASRAAVRGR